MHFFRHLFNPNFKAFFGHCEKARPRLRCASEENGPGVRIPLVTEDLVAELVDAQQVSVDPVGRASFISGAEEVIITRPVRPDEVGPVPDVGLECRLGIEEAVRR